MSRNPVVVAVILGAAASPLLFTGLGLIGGASAHPQLEECAGSLVRSQGLSPKEARSVCGGAHESVQPDLNDCAASLALSQGITPKKAKSVCEGSSSEHIVG